MDHTKNILDGAAILNVVGTLMGWLPALAALLTIIWTGIRIYEYFKKKVS